MSDKNKMTVIDGVRYELSPADYVLASDHIKQLRQILSRATVVKGTDASIVKTDNLNDAVIKKLAGCQNIVYYNYETKAWNTNTYNGYPINGQKIDTMVAKAFKEAMEKMPEFRAQYEMVASVTMTIESKFYPGWKKTISNPVYSKKGTSVVGNIIVKNKITGKYELYCKSWVGGNDYYFTAGAVSNGACGFAYYGARNSDFRAALIAAHTR